MEDVEQSAVKMESIKLEDPATSSRFDASLGRNGHSNDDLKDQSSTSTLSPDDAKARSDSASTPDTTVSLKQSKKASQKSSRRAPTLYDHLDDVTEDACKTFQVIPDCIYGKKDMGSTNNDALDCDCKEEWRNGINYACGEDCINRATRVECVIGASGSCGDDCQNQRFQRKQYADVSVVKTDKKGFGLRANTPLEANDFVHEYIGEAINEATFRRRMMQYDDEGIKHFYFMSLSKGEFIDATKKGNLGRFCNHSCNPNCYVDKWVVGEKMRMGIFALRGVRAGEELTFNYNVDRYGADPQPCYCGEAECVGFIGGKTQTERATKLPATIVEALGIDDEDGWDTTVTKKPRKKRPDEDDEEYVNSVQAKSLSIDGARKLMAALMQCKEKWIAVKLLERIQRCQDERVLNEVLRMHAYQIMKTTLNNFHEDDNVILQVLDVLDRFPRLTKNKIADSSIEVTIDVLAKSENVEVADNARKLLDDWAKLNVGFRIKRRKIDPNAQHNHARTAETLRSMVLGKQEEKQQTPETTASKSPLPNVEIPKGPRNSMPQRQHFNQVPRPQHPRRPAFFNGPPLPDGWFQAKDQRGNTYFYNRIGETQWTRPTEQTAPQGPKQPSKAERDAQILQSIIDQATKDKPKKSTPNNDAAASTTPSEVDTPRAKESRHDTWKSLSLDKQMKMYRNTIFPYIKPVLDKYYGKLKKEDLKKFAKELSQKFATSDFKNGRVQDPRAPLNEKSIKGIKNYTKSFLDKAVVKHQQRETAKEEERKQAAEAGVSAAVSPSETPAKEDAPMDDAAYEMDISPADESTPNSPSLKRKREDEDENLGSAISPTDDNPAKQLQEDLNGSESSPPPPPPPPPEVVMVDEEMTEEKRLLKEQEEELMRENEEAERLENEAAWTGEGVAAS